MRRCQSYNVGFSELLVSDGFGGKRVQLQPLSHLQTLVKSKLKSFQRLAEFVFRLRTVPAGSDRSAMAEPDGLHRSEAYF